MDNLSIQQINLYVHLVEVLCFFIRQHSFRSKYFILSEGLAARVAQLMECPEKHLKLSTLSAETTHFFSNVDQLLSSISALALDCTTRRITGRLFNTSCLIRF